MAHIQMKCETECRISLCIPLLILAYTSTMKLVGISTLSLSCLPISNKNRILFIDPHIFLYTYIIISLYPDSS